MECTKEYSRNGKDCGLRIADCGFQRRKALSIRSPKSAIRKVSLYENAQVTRFGVGTCGMCAGPRTCQRSRGYLCRCRESGIRAQRKRTRKDPDMGRVRSDGRA